EVERKAGVLGARLRTDHASERGRVSSAGIDGRERLDQRALAAPVLADEERDPRRDLEAAVGDHLGDRGDGERPPGQIRRAHGVRRPDDAFEVTRLHRPIVPWAVRSAVRALAARVSKAQRITASGRGPIARDRATARTATSAGYP